MGAAKKKNLSVVKTTREEGQTGVAEELGGAVSDLCEGRIYKNERLAFDPEGTLLKMMLRRK